MGLGRARDEAAQARALATAEVCWTAATGLGFADLATSAAFFARGTRLAVEAGNPVRATKWLAFHALQLALLGRRAHHRARRAIAIAAVAARSRGDDVASAMVRWAEGAS